MSDLILLPNPKSLQLTKGVFELSGPAVIGFQPDLASIADFLAESLVDEFGLDPKVLPSTSKKAKTICLGVDAQFGPQSYSLVVDESGVTILGGDPAGAFYGCQTLIQILRQYPREIPCLEIEDAPDFPTRGLMLDISRDKVPTMETLRLIVDRLAEWKINHFELYMEHTFAYSDHKEVWAQASPMTAEEVRELDAYCKARFIELVPNQNSFGHLHRWLELPRYIDLSEAAMGADTPWNTHNKESFSICPLDPHSTEFLAELYDELLPNFSSTKFNVGCDETYDLGQGRSKEECEKKGKGRVYLEFLLKIQKLVKERGRTMHFWGDIILEHPELVPELPKDIVALNWGYGEEHPFAKETAKFKEAGVPFYVCPGTSTWLSIGGMTDKCLLNVANAVVNGKKNGAIGVLNTDWGDLGHWQPTSVSYLGYAVGAAYSWSYERNCELDWPAALSLHAFKDSAGIMGQIAFDLGNARYCMPRKMETDFPFYALYARDSEKGVPDGVTADNLLETREYIRKTIEPLRLTEMNAPDADLILLEYELAAEMMDFACDRGLAIIDGELKKPDTRLRHSARLSGILGDYRELWVKRNRVGGLQDSVKVIEQRFKEASSKYEA